MATQMQALEGVSPCKNTAALLQEAIVSVRKYLEAASEADGRLILGIGLLAYAEVHRTNPQAARVLVLAVKDLVGRLGGLRIRLPYLQWWIAAVDELTTVELLPVKTVFASDWFNRAILQSLHDDRSAKPHDILTATSLEDKLRPVMYLQSVQGFALLQLARELVFARIGSSAPGS